MCVCACVRACVCVRVRVCEREREGGREREKERDNVRAYGVCVSVEYVCVYVWILRKHGICCVV